MPGNNLNTDKNGFIRKSSLVIIGLFLLGYIALLGVAPISIPDEGCYSKIPRELIISGIVSGEYLLSSVRAWEEELSEPIFEDSNGEETFIFAQFE